MRPRTDPVIKTLLYVLELPGSKAGLSISDARGGPAAGRFAVKPGPIMRKFLSYQGPVRILDLGSTAGCLQEVLEANAPARAKVYYYSLDARSTAPRAAGMTPALRLVRDLRSGLPFRDGAFDFVFSSEEAARHLNIRESEKLFKEMSRVLKTGGVFVYSTAGLSGARTRSLRKNDLFLMKTYGGQDQYNALRPRNEPVNIKIEKSYQKELFEAVRARCCPWPVGQKLLFISKGKANLADEVKTLFPGEEASPLGHRGNSVLFATSREIIKYLPKSALEKYLEVYGLLNGRAGINLPEIIGISESEVSEHYLVRMKKVDGTPLTDAWEGLTEKERVAVVCGLAAALKRVHSVHFKPGAIPRHFRQLEGCAGWKEEIFAACLAELDHCKEKHIVGESLRSAFLSLLKQSINKVAPAGYVLLHRDMNFNNIMVGRGNKLTLLFDFETCTAGDKYLDLVVTGLFFEEKYRKVLFSAYGVPGNFDKISAAYRLIAILCFLRTKVIEKGKEKEVLEFIRTGRSRAVSPAAWTVPQGGRRPPGHLQG